MTRRKFACIKALLFMFPFLSFLAVWVADPADAKAPLLAMISATCLCIGYIPTARTLIERGVQAFVLLLAYGSGVDAALSWLGTIVQIESFWYIAALLLALVSAVALLIGGNEKTG